MLFFRTVILYLGQWKKGKKRIEYMVDLKHRFVQQELRILIM